MLWSSAFGFVTVRPIVAEIVRGRVADPVAGGVVHDRPLANGL
ncbi:hypothetical protein [Streptomyces sp. NBC_00829]|nr:hypothetical protein OG293_16305 [Streptomyces sp. NBC_00829]